MKKSFLNRIVVVMLCGLFVGFGYAEAQQKPESQPKLSPDEAKLANNINSGSDTTAKMNAVAELIKKYPKTSIRPQVVAMAAQEIANVKDPAQKLALAQQLQTIFSDPTEAEIVGPVVVQAYADANQPDEAFAKGAEFLSRAPDSLNLLVQLVAVGTDTVKKQNPKFIPQTIQYATRAIELLEADKKPAMMDDARWKEFKPETVFVLHQSLGMLYFAKGDAAMAKTLYTKASVLRPSDAFNFVMLGALLNQEYQDEAKRYQAMAPGPARDELLKKVQALLDSVIDAYAHAVALSEGNATLEQIRQQYAQDLASYYKYRHNGSTEGMQQLVDKYKVGAKP